MSHLQNTDPSQMVHHQLQQPQLQQQQQQQQQYLQQPESEESKYKRYFYNRAQAQSEKSQEFLSELERLARGAKIDHEMPHSSLEALIRERFVIGLKNSHTQVN
jgi:hypothetical protein